MTGAAGFIGSHLAERLAAHDATVLGVDCLTSFYPATVKQRNVAALLGSERFALSPADLRSDPLVELMDGVDVVFHQAAQPGVRDSWGSEFDLYTGHNVLATQRVLEAALAAGVSRVVYASSSSVYGNARDFPLTERSLPEPYSPYGVTKLAAEHLCRLYAMNYGLRTVALRYFTVYGPRQRPDMAIQRLIAAAVRGTEFRVFGDGMQQRDFTYVDDVVEANVLAATADVEAGSVINIAGGSTVSLADLILLVGDVVGSPVRTVIDPPSPGDVDRTEGSTERAQRVLGWRPEVGLEDGLRSQLAWLVDGDERS